MSACSAGGTRAMAEGKRSRALEQAKRHRAAREAQAELRRMRRDPGSLLGAVERLRRAKEEADRASDDEAGA